MTTPDFGSRNGLSLLTAGNDDTVYFVIEPGVGHGQFLCAVDGDGSLRWRIWSVQHEGLSRCSVPVIGPAGDLYICSAKDSSDVIHCLDPNGTLKWSLNTEKKIVTPVLVDARGTLYCADMTGVVLAIGATGRTKWRYHTDQSEGTRLYGGCLAFGRRGTLYYAASNDALYAMGESE